MTDDLAKKAAQLSMQTLLTLPSSTRVAAVTMMLQLVLMTDVKADKRLEFFSSLVDRIRDDLVNDLNKGVLNAKDGDQRRRRSKATRKKGGR